LNYLQLYNSLCKTTIVLICLVISAGGFVRMTGSGMGCPDWPKCFGLWVPPMDVSDLPLNYKEIYAHRGYDQLDFNAFHTWTEYINRLLGVLAGLFCLILLSVSFCLKNKPLIFLNFFLVSLMIFQGWMGAVVVYSVLAPFKITIHMLIALFIVGVLLVLNTITSNRRITNIKQQHTLMYVALLVTIIQIILGTQVRENVDLLILTLERSDVISQLSNVFEFHRSLAWVVLAVNLLVVHVYRKDGLIFYETSLILFALFGLIFSGISMNYFNLPGPSQLLHLIFMVFLFIGQSSIILKHSNLPTLKFPSFG